MAFGVDHAATRFVGFWGDKTSTLDWCEENYHHTSYIAEFWNSTSNFFFMYIAVAGMLNTRRSGLPMRFTILYLWLFVVGLGSMLFHATLKWSMQLLDEVPMIYMSCHILHCILYPRDERHSSWWRRSVWPLYSVAIAVTIAYMRVGNPVLHQVCFGGIIVLCALQYPVFSEMHTAGLSDAKAVKSQVFHMFLKAAALMLSAFGIWNIDNVACRHLRMMRESLPAPFSLLAPLLQFHAIWHVLTIAAADYTVAAITYMWCQGRRAEFHAEIRYKLLGAFPQVLTTPIKRKSPRNHPIRSNHSKQ